MADTMEIMAFLLVLLKVNMGLVVINVLGFGYLVLALNNFKAHHAKTDNTPRA